MPVSVIKFQMKWSSVIVPSIYPIVITQMSSVLEAETYWLEMFFVSCLTFWEVSVTNLLLTQSAP